MKKGFLLPLVVVFAVSASAERPNPAAQEPRPPTWPQPSATTQQPPPGSDEDVVRISTNVVQVDAVVTDANGKPVTDLKHEERRSFEDGTRQTVTHCAC